MKSIVCRTHGGVFEIPPKRGRQPVRCGGKYPSCSRATMADAEGAPLEKHNGAAVVASAPRSFSNSSLPPAMLAKKQLEAVGWAVEGRAWLGDGNADDGYGSWAEVVASRQQETLVMRWLNGKLDSQSYTMEYANPTRNNYPESQLDFDPDQLTDGELVRMISGMKVTWWNTLANSTETGIIPGERVRVEHIFAASGEEDMTKRIVTFIDHGGGGFRSFHVRALIKVG